MLPKVYDGLAQEIMTKTHPISISKGRRTSQVEKIPHQVLALSLFEDLGAPKGLAGFVDWRMHGFISQQMVQGHIQGHADECILVSLQKPFVAQKLCLFGLGSYKDYGVKQLELALVGMTEKLFGLNPASCFLSIPQLPPHRQAHQAYETVTNYFSKIQLPFPIEIQLADILNTHFDQPREHIS